MRELKLKPNQMNQIKPKKKLYIIQAVSHQTPPMPISTEVQQKALQLRLVRHKHAANIALHARIIEIAAKEIKAINAAIERESVAIAGEDYLDEHTVHFEPCPSIDDQLNDDVDVVRGAGIDDVIAYASAVVIDATKAAFVPADAALPLPSEK